MTQIDETRSTKYNKSPEECVDDYFLLFEGNLGKGEIISTQMLEHMLESAYNV